MLGQYVKDLSFESPGAPGTLQSPPKNPQLQVSVNVGAVRQTGEAYEVTLNLEAQAKSEAGIIYNVELAYGGAVSAQERAGADAPAGAADRLPDPAVSRSCAGWSPT